jgi:hypothetical protein
LPFVAEDDGKRYQMRVFKAIVKKDKYMEKRPTYLRIIWEVPNSNVDAIHTYNEIIDNVEKDNSEIENDNEQHYKF